MYLEIPLNASHTAKLELYKISINQYILLYKKGMSDISIKLKIEQIWW